VEGTIPAEYSAKSPDLSPLLEMILLRISGGLKTGDDFYRCIYG
jgi:hypothetical protein